MNLEQLKRFRQDIYELLRKAKDATMDLRDAVLTTKSRQSFAELSLSPVFRRKWPSLYKAIELSIKKKEDQENRVINSLFLNPILGFLQ